MKDYEQATNSGPACLLVSWLKMGLATTAIIARFSTCILPYCRDFLATNKGTDGHGACLALARYGILWDGMRRDRRGRYVRYAI